MKKFKSILLFSFAFLLIVAFFEFYLSFGGILAPVVRIDPNVGERYYPNKTCCSMFVCEGFGLAKTNSTGWFGKDFKDNGVSDKSVAVIGSSYVAGRQLFYRDNFLSLSETEINQNITSSKVSFFNFGKEDLPFKELLCIKEEVDTTYHPDYIMVFVNKGTFATSNRYTPYYELINDSLQLNLSFKNSSFVKMYNKVSLIAKSSVFFMIYRVKNRLHEANKIILDKFSTSTPLEDDTHNHESKEPLVIQAVQKAIIEKLDQDKRVVFLLDLDSARSSAFRKIVKTSPIIDVHPLLLKMKSEQGIDPYYWKVTEQHGHWNMPAHKVIANEISRVMVNIIKEK